MISKKLVKNLTYYLNSLSSIEIPVYTFDNHNTRDIPAVIVGYTSEVNSFPGDHGHYTVGGFVNVLFQGYEDLDNVDGDDVADKVNDALCDRQALETALNAPLSGVDPRPANKFGINQLFNRGSTRDDDGHSTEISIQFDAFCVAVDLN